MSFNPNDFITEDTSRKSDKEYPKPNEGSQLGVVNLIVDLGVQEREDYVDPKTEEVKELTPVNQFAVFLDLPESMRDYGEDIGEKPFRLRTVKYGKKGLQGWNFVSVFPQDPNGKTNYDGLKTFHPNSPFRKLAKATDQTQIFSSVEDNMDISQLLGKACMVDVEVSEWVSKKDPSKSGTNIRHKSFSKLGPTYQDKIFPDGLPEMEAPMLVTFGNATAESVKWLHRDIVEKIKEASNYEGSQIQRAFVEAGKDKSSKVEDELHMANQQNLGPAVDEVDYDDDIPF